MPLQATSGAASYDAFGGGVAAVPNYIEEVFSTYLYTGNGSTQTITNGIDLSGKGGLVWTKARVDRYHNLEDTVRGAGNSLWSNASSANYYYSDAITSFGSTGYTLGADGTGNQVNSSANYVSWTFRKQPKFFDVVTFTGTQNSSGTGQVVSHNLGSTPACIIVKPITDTSGTGFSIADWIVYHRSLSSPTTQYLKLNSTAAIDGNSDKIRAVSDTTFTAGWEIGYTGIQYVAYIFAHDAGGFGLTGTDNVISCGSFDGTANTAVTLGYEPQWIMFKNTTSTSNWQIIDNMRGMVVSSDDRQLLANSSNAEGDNNLVSPTATGFTWIPSAAGNTYIYIAIRRGPMKVPTSGTSVFYPNAYSGTGTDTTITSTGFPPDLFFSKARSFDSLYLNVMVDRLRGASQFLVPTNTIAETVGTNVVLSLNMNGVTVGSSSNANSGTVTYVQWNFRRAPSFFDEVCYTGNNINGRTITHNLTVTPELIIAKRRTGGAEQWPVYVNAITASKVLELNTTIAATTYNGYWNNTAPTSSVFTIGDTSAINASGSPFVAYLFATCAGVSKVGSYTGTGTTLQIDCGFTGGARFVLIKRTDSTGDWYVWDSARGIVSGNDPYLLLNSTAAETTSTDYIDAYSAGFEISSTAPAAINASGGTFIFLAIA